jgi:hypothetical protein
MMSFTKWVPLKLTIVALPLASFTLGHRGRAYPKLVANENLRQIPPEIVLRTMNGEKHLIQMPFIAWLRAPAPKLIGIQLSEFQTPLADSFVCDNDPTSEQQLFDITIAEAEAVRATPRG